MKLWLIYLLPITLVSAFSRPSSLLHPGPIKVLFSGNEGRGELNKDREMAP